LNSAITVAFGLHTLFCVGFTLVAARTAMGVGRVAVVEEGPGAPDWGENSVSSIFFAAGALYLVYAEIYLYRMHSLAALTGN
jgi:hypothetical protein